MSLGAAVRRVTDRATAVTRLEIELATLELRKKAAQLGIGIGLGLGAALLGLLTFGFLLATIAAALATFLATWLALLIMTAALGGGEVGLHRVRRAGHLGAQAALLGHIGDRLAAAAASAAPCEGGDSRRNRQYGQPTHREP